MFHSYIEKRRKEDIGGCVEIQTHTCIEEGKEVESESKGGGGPSPLWIKEEEVEVM